MKKFSHIWILVSLALLGVFLGVWVYDSFKEEKSRLEGEVNLEIAHLLFETVDIDFGQLIHGLKIGDAIKHPKSISITAYDTISTSFSPNIQAGVHFDTSPGPGPGRIFRKHVFKDSVKFPPFPIMEGDTGWPEGSQMVIATARESEISQKNVLREIYPEKYQAEFDAAMSTVHRDAFFAIIPQLLLAIGLFGVIIFAVLMLQKNYQQKELEMEAKNQFISNMTHELKTPVATIGIALEAIQDFSAAPEKAEQYMRTSRAELDRLAKLIDQVMSASQKHHNSANYIKEIITFPEFLQPVINSLSPQIEEKKAHISLQVPRTDLHILGDPQHLANMFRNLLDNSLKYSQEGVEITCIVKSEGGKVYCCIRDNGIGIPARFQKKVFDQFFRVPTGNIHTVKGYGLGLNYVEQVVQAHDGKIQLNSQEGKGTEIQIHFPLYHE